MSSGVKVAVRVRPFSDRERHRNAKEIVHVQEGRQVLVRRPADYAENLKSDFIGLESRKTSGEDPKRFAYDFAYWSVPAEKECGDDVPVMESAENGRSYASQVQIYQDLGRELLEHAFQGYNSTIMAYGQTGSGKSYTMMGGSAEEERGLIPRICRELFRRVEERSADPEQSFNVEVSYMEIYCERVRDLLHPNMAGKESLRVREHPLIGPYVEGLSKLTVASHQEIEHLMEQGNRARTVAATHLNETSSRSHAVFTIILTQRNRDPTTQMISEKASRLCLVDLAGSERAHATGATGERFKEGANINRSLTTLGKVISALAEQSLVSASAQSNQAVSGLSESVKTTASGKKPSPQSTFIPYRDSNLTWLLKDSLGGNSKLAIIATISPADLCYDETLSTLRYADRAKRIVTKAVINEDPNVKLIRELKEEVKRLRDLLSSATQSNGHSDTSTVADTAELAERLQMAQILMEEMNLTWEEKLRKSQQVAQQRDRTLDEVGILVSRHQSGALVGVSSPKRAPHLLNLSEDPLMSECLIYHIKSGITRVGQPQVLPEPNHIQLSGDRIQALHCHFENIDGVVTLIPHAGCSVLVNGLVITEPKRLYSGYRIVLGDHHLFRFNHPSEVRKDREMQRRRSSLALAPDSGLMQSPSSEFAAWDVLSESEFTSSSQRRNAPLHMLTDIEKVNQLQQEELDKDVQTEFQDFALVPKKLFPKSANVSSPPIESERQSYFTASEGFLPLTSEQMQLAQKVVQVWKSYRFTSLMDTILANTPQLKEAKIISSELGMNLDFGFKVLYPKLEGNVQSFWNSLSENSKQEPLSLEEEISDDLDESFFLHSADTPRIAVEVNDPDSALPMTWSMEKFHRHLQQMRSKFNLTESQLAFPSLREGVTSHEASFQHLGTAFISINALMTGSVRAAIISTKYGRIEGWLEASVEIVPAIDDIHTEPLMELHIATVELGKDLPPARAHTQYRFSDIDNTVEHDRVFYSQPVESTEEGIVLVNHRQTFDTKWSLDHDRQRHVQVDIFWCPLRRDSPRHQRRNQSLASHSVDSLVRKYCVNLPEYALSELPTVSRSMEPSRHDVHASIQIHELADCGEFLPVPFVADSGFSINDPGVFYLRQGIQRRISVTLSHDSGTRLPILGTRSVRVGQIRRCDRNGKNLYLSSPESHLPFVELQLLSSRSRRGCTKDGRSFLGVEACWDSALHESSLLNRITIAKGEARDRTRVVVRIVWELDVDGCVEPLRFETDVYLQILPRDSKRAQSSPFAVRSMGGGLFVSLFSSRVERCIGKFSAMFEVVLKPLLANSALLPVPASTSALAIASEHHDTHGGSHTKYRQNVLMERRLDLWRGSNAYVRGEENLHGWTPNGLKSLLEGQYVRMRVDWLMAWDRTRQFLMTHPARNFAGTKKNAREQAELLLRVLRLWRRSSSIDGNRNAKDAVVPWPSDSTRPHQAAPAQQWMTIGTVSLQPKPDIVAFSGYLHYPEEPGFSDVWLKRWFVLRRPYLFMYEDNTETQEHAVLGLSDMSTQWNLQVLEAATNRPHLFCIYTRHHAHLLQADSETSKYAWLSRLDPLRWSVEMSNRQVDGGAP